MSQIAIMASFDMDHPDNRVEYDIWMTSSNVKALDFIASFGQTDKELGENVLMTPHYVFWKCKDCDKEYLKNDCYGGGKYCAIENKDDNIRGRDIIMEDLRQICLYKSLYDNPKTRFMWWAYMRKVH